MNAAPKVPYKEQFLFATELQLAPWTVDWDGATASGPCPVCTHGTNAELLKEAVALGADDTTSHDIELIRVFNCSCGNIHKAGDVEYSNCGAKWPVRILKPLQADASLEVPTPDVSLVAARELAKQSGKQESIVRGAAEKWIGGITALLALFGISGVAVGKDNLRALDQPWQTVAAIAILAGVVCAIAAIINIYRTAFGWPNVVDVDTTEKLNAWYKNKQSDLRKAADRFRNGLYCAVASLVFLFIAAGLVALSPVDEPAPRVKATSTDGGFVCGVLLDSTTDGELRLREDDGSVQTITLGELVRVETVEDCA